MFQLNKQLILTARKLEEGGLENYTHMATLIHKLNLLLLEFDKVFHLKSAISLIFTPKLLETIVDFAVNTDSFANFGIRFLEICAITHSDEIQESGIIQVAAGLLRTNDYETVAQCLSFISVLADCQVLQEKDLLKVINPKLINLILKTNSKQCELEYIHYVVSIVNHCVRVKELREVLLSETLVKKDQQNGAAGVTASETYTEFLANYVEKQAEVISIPKLFQRVVRQRKELQQWHKAK